MNGPMDDDDFDPSQLDPGIRQVVLFLRGLGFTTTDSGDGRWKWRCAGCGAQPGEKHMATDECGRRAGRVVSRRERGEGLALPYPHVFMVVETGSLLTRLTETLLAELGRAGVELGQVGQEWPADEEDEHAWRFMPAIQATYDPVTKRGIIELAYLDDGEFAEAVPL